MGYLIRDRGHERDVPMAAPGDFAPRRVRLTDSALIGELKSFLEKVECRVRNVGLATLDVAIPRAPSPDQAERELRIYLRMWEAMNRGVYARIVGEGGEKPPS